MAEWHQVAQSCGFHCGRVKSKSRNIITLLHLHAAGVPRTSASTHGNRKKHSRATWRMSNKMHLCRGGPICCCLGRVSNGLA